VTSFFGNLYEVVDRVVDKANLAKAQDSVGSMTVDPDKVDEIAAFFREKSKMLFDRAMDVQELANVKTPGRDPVSLGSTKVFGAVGSGDGSGYVENYLKLAQVLEDAAAALEGNTRQWRTNDQDSADSFGGGKA
jgi:hypothetical protein